MSLFKNIPALTLPLALIACASQTTVEMPAACTAPHLFQTAPAYSSGTTEPFNTAAQHRHENIGMGDFRGELRTWLDMTDATARDNDSGKAACAIAWLDLWAQNNHLREDPAGSMAAQAASREETLTALQSIATAYALTLRERTDRSERRHIERWLRKVAGDVADAGIDDIPPARQDIRYLRAGAAVMAAAVATEDEDLMAIAYGVYRNGIDRIRPDGSLSGLPDVLPGALRAHLQALVPLTLMNTLSHRQGDDWSHYKPERLARLTDFTLHALADPSQANHQQSGTTQDSSSLAPCAEEFAWTPFWLRYDAKRVSRLIPAPGTCSWLRLGGDLSLLKARGRFEATEETMHVSP